MAKEKVICGACGTVGLGKSHTKGSFLIEVVLWLLFCVPGVIYTLWRLTSKTTVCRKCESPDLIPVSSPLGKKLLKKPTSKRKPRA